MTANWPDREPLVGRFVRLDVLELSDLPSLFEAIGYPVIFAGGYGGGPAGYRDTVDAFVEWATHYYQWKSNVYGVRIAGGPHNGELVGTTTLGNLDLAAESAEIGWTAYAPEVWGTQVNAECKLLLLEKAFDNGFGRVRIAADVLNERSRAAIDGIGATFEGVVRREKQRADGSWRDTALFSVIIDDWPVVSMKLEERLATYGERPVLFRTPPTNPGVPR